MESHRVVNKLFNTHPLTIHHTHEIKGAFK